MAKKSNATVGVFETRAAAERAVADLRAAGYRDDQISIIARDERGNTVHTDATGHNNAADGAALGVATGAGVAALGSLAVSFGIIPVIGPILAAGPIAAAVLSGATGAAVGGIAGALIGSGIPEEDARFYEEEVKAGRYVVSVHGDRAADASAVYTRHGGYDHSTANAAGRTIQVKEEKLRANKEVERGEVNVRKEVHTEQKQITVPVEREEVVIERRPASGHATGEIKAEQIRIPTKEEHVRVEKEAVVKEEVAVGKRKVQDTQTVSGEVKKEEIVVETEGQAKVRQTGKTDKK